MQRYGVTASQGMTAYVVWDRQKRCVVEKHTSFAKAQAGAKRLNGTCLHCDRPLADCKRDMPRDENFGSEYDDSEEDD